MSDSHKSKSEMRTLVNDDFRAGHERIFGERKPNRGRWVVDPKSGALVPIEEYVPEAETERVPVLTDRYMENDVATDGTPINSRRRRAEYMRANGLADSSDYSSASMERVKRIREAQDRKELRQELGRTHYEMSKRKRR